MLDKVFEGTIDKWVDRGNAAGFGFVGFESGSRIDRAFFSHDDITPDALGRRSHAKIVGSPIRFKLSKYLYRGEPSAKAVEVQSIFSADVENVQDHREVSVVEHILKGSRQPIASVFLKRRSGDKLYLGIEDVAADHKEGFRRLRVGDHVWSGIAPPLGNQRTWRATAAEFYSPEEEAALREQEIQRCERN
jgi:hypothetical protein